MKYKGINIHMRNTKVREKVLNTSIVGKWFKLFFLMRKEMIETWYKYFISGPDKQFRSLDACFALYRPLLTSVVPHLAFCSLQWVTPKQRSQNSS